jgi:hypothetical protein
MPREKEYKVITSREKLTSTLEPTKIPAPAFLWELQAILHHLCRKRGRLQLVTHAGLVRSPHHVAAPCGWRWRARTLDGTQTRQKRVGVAHARGTG